MSIDIRRDDYVEDIYYDSLTYSSGMRVSFYQFKVAFTESIEYMNIVELPFNVKGTSMLKYYNEIISTNLLVLQKFSLESDKYTSSTYTPIPPDCFVKVYPAKKDRARGIIIMSQNPISLLNTKALKFNTTGYYHNSIDKLNEWIMLCQRDINQKQRREWITFQEAVIRCTSDTKRNKMSQILRFINQPGCKHLKVHLLSFL